MHSGCDKCGGASDHMIGIVVTWTSVRNIGYKLTGCDLGVLSRYSWSIENEKMTSESKGEPAVMNSLNARDIKCR